MLKFLAYISRTGVNCVFVVDYRQIWTGSVVSIYGSRVVYVGLSHCKHSVLCVTFGFPA